MRIYFYLRKFNLCRGAFEFFPEAVDTTSMTVRVRCRRRSVLNTTAVLQKRVVDRDHNAVADLDLDRGSNRTLKSPERGRGTSFPLEGLLEGFQILQSGGSLRRVRRISPPPPPDYGYGYRLCVVWIRPTTTSLRTSIVGHGRPRVAENARERVTQRAAAVSVT